ncbi:MAG: translocation/assembly module TamB domain-containing protein [Bacteroidales bacterium]|nr:translocation/assembly module TamB domain-containing protein [Bacteroidales bacterium]
MKKLLKIVLVTLVVLIVLVLSVPVALYTPWAQQIAVREALAIMNDNDDDLRYDIGALRLRWPLDVELWDVGVWRVSTADTVAFVHHLRTALDDWPREGQTDYVVRELLVEGLKTGIDTAFVAGLDLRGGVDTLLIDGVRLNLDSSRVIVADVLIAAPRLAVSYAADTTAVEEEADTTQTAAWRVRLGALAITDAVLQYGGDVAVDGLDVRVADFAMDSALYSLDTLAIKLPEARYAGFSLADVALRLTRFRMDSVRAQMDSLAIDMPTAHLALKASAKYPLDNRRREAMADVHAWLVRPDSLLSLYATPAEERDYRLPDSLSLAINATQLRDQMDARLTLAQGTVTRVEASAAFNQMTEAYRAAVEVRDLVPADYVKALPIGGVRLSLQAEGQHFDIGHKETRLRASLRLDTASYVLANDTAATTVSVHGTEIDAALANDTLQLTAGINAALSDLGSFDSLRIAFTNSPNRMRLNLNLGDARIDVGADCDLEQLMTVSDRVMHELDMQSTNKAFDINAIQRTLPHLALDIAMRQDNPLMPLLRQQGVAFDNLSVRLTNTDSLRLAAAIDTLVYDSIRVARIGADLVPRDGNYDYVGSVLYADTMTGADFRLGVKARLESDSITAMGDLWADTLQVFTFDACLSQRIRADVYLATLPLALANAFIGDDVQLTGFLNGHARLDCDSVDFNAFEAAVWFDSASVWYEGCDMTIGLPSDSIVYRDGQLHLDHIRFQTHNGRPIEIDGTVDLRRDMANPDIDLMILADRAELVRNKRRRSRGQFLYGTLPLSTSIAVVGVANDLHVNGQITIPPGCDLTYFFEDEALSKSSQLTDLVEFRSFAEMEFPEIDSLANAPTLPPPPRRDRSNLEVNLKLRIDPTTQALVYLPTSSDDQVMIRGGGDLKLSMDGNGALQLSGGYNVTGGDINFKLPMLPVTKQFALTNDGWLRWSGIVDRPELSLTATETVKCTINDVSGGQRVVKFVVSILISGTLENMDIVFNCSAPDDAAIQSELATLTDEERSKQAMLLLVAQTYSGPSASTSAGINSANAAISSLVNKELESLLTNKLKHTEINVGIDTYDATGTGAQQTDYTVSVSQRFFNDRMRVTVGGKMSTGEEVQQDDGSIINDVSVEWMIRRDASQYARLFRHTNYESVLEGEVVETGIGYVQSRDAYRFWQLFIRSGKKREAARQEMLKRLQSQQIEQLRQEGRSKKALANDPEKNDVNANEPTTSDKK